MSHLRLIISLAFALCLLSYSSSATMAQESDVDVATPHAPRVRVIQPGQSNSDRPVARTVAFAGKPGMQKASYLGVVPVPVSSELSAQLNLPEGVGLRVAGLIPDSPAVKAQIKQHDVLHKLGDQLLVNAEQLRTLVRQHKKGDKVTVTVIRGGKSQEVTVTIDEREMPVGQQGPPPVMRFSPDMKWQDAQRWIEQAGPAARIGLHDLSAQTVKLKDDTHTLTLTQRDNKKHLKIEDNDGKVVFEGPINTDAERAAVPDNVKPKLKKLESMIPGQKKDAKAALDGDGGQAESDRLELKGNLGIDLKNLDLDIELDTDGKVDLEKLRDQLRDRMKKALEGHKKALRLHQFHIRPGGGQGGIEVQSSASAVYADGTHTLTVTTKDGKKHLKATDKAGKVLFDGPIDTDDQRAKVPQDIRTKLDRLESTAKVRIRIQPFGPGQPVPPAPRDPAEPPAPEVF